MSLLSELCSICYVEKPKYRCPRCKTGTCSLPCYKRHQQRASCNGQRDPAEYLKKSQLATPEGIDRDFNYLKGVERDMDNAHRDTRDRGIGSSNRTTKTAYRGGLPESKFQRYLGNNRITVARAPKGMSRQKSNQTRSTKRDHIMWTIEWIDSEGKSEVQHNCLETMTIEDAFSSSPNGKVHKPDSKKKRKRQELESEDAAAEVQDAPGSQVAATSASAADEDDEPPLDNQAPEESSKSKGLESEPKEEEAPQEEDTPKNAENPQEAERPKPERFYYLLKVGTSSASKVLIPLMPNCTLTESLQDQTVMEYPTYYVLAYSPSKLPPGFMTEHQYLKIRKGEEQELDEALVKAEEDGVLRSGRESDPRAGGTASASQMDANKILDMLKRDVTR